MIDGRLPFWCEPRRAIGSRDASSASIDQGKAC
jgi:hypothetical protein